MRFSFGEEANVREGFRAWVGSDSVYFLLAADSQSVAGTVMQDGDEFLAYNRYGALVGVFDTYPEGLLEIVERDPS